MSLRILLVDDHEVVRLGLRALISRYPHFEVVGEAAGADESLQQVGHLHPDVVVMDIRLPGRGARRSPCKKVMGRAWAGRRAAALAWATARASADASTA